MSLIKVINSFIYFSKKVLSKLLEMSHINHPFVVWASCFLWLTSMFAITWSLVLFFCVGDILIITGTDLLNALVLLLGIIMLPTNVFMLYTIAIGERINHKSKVMCCPLWLCILWIIIINGVGVALCAQRIHLCDQIATKCLSYSMKNYRSVPKYKHFIDNLQWSLKCCGLNSYKDWFKEGWYDKIRDYEWDPSDKQKRDFKKQDSVADSVPLSCCKSGSCVSNFLTELGTHSIHTKGCSTSIHRILMLSMSAHLIVFTLIVITEIILLKCIASEDDSGLCTEKDTSIHIRHLMEINNKFDMSSGSSSCHPDDSDDFRGGS